MYLKEKYTLQNPLLSPVSLASSCSGTLFTREDYFEVFKIILSVLRPGLLGWWVSAVDVVLCSSYLKSWLRSQVTLGGLLPKDMPASQVIL